ncbi:lytic transglycosylase domain-containing protein [Cognatilysobacter lacus]|uniref:Transglycosylase SLT domain-containing protein n=1 Tax=Cognatilysobacter lacus TaxID=1643323 RepID=A0A5D8ZAP9_9GAMM|nr:lytic transglycosylase domain-containing protein [Lysobacter lacus]TZF91710.1 transglycosylase SLT domain-containing protein [Lysobacter lacus]
MNTLLNKTGAAALVAALGLAATGTTLAADASDSRNGREIYEHFRAGLAEPECPAQPSRWTHQFANAPERLADRSDDTLVLFGHVVESVRAAHLPTEYALIPFVESGYKPSARSSAGPAGLWQMITTTARNHNVPMRAGYDGRLSPVDSTRAAVRYLKTLHGMFGGNWRLAVMAYNAGEYRVFGAIKRAGQTPRTAKPESLGGLSAITQAYDDKLHAISCVIARADDQPRFMASLDRPVRALGPIASSQTMIAMERPKPSPAAAIETASVMAPGSAASALGSVAGASPGASAVASVLSPSPQPASADTVAAFATSSPRRHIVAAGESLWMIARRYKVSVAELLSLNGLHASRLLAPGMVLAVDSLASK